MFNKAMSLALAVLKEELSFEIRKYIQNKDVFKYKYKGLACSLLLYSKGIKSV